MKTIKNIFRSILESFSLINMVKFYRLELEKLERDYNSLKYQNSKLNAEVEKLEYQIIRMKRE